MVRRGDLFGSSFAYTTDEDVEGNVRYDKEGDTLIRKVCKIDRLYDVSIVSDPAYLATSVNARSLDAFLKPASTGDENWEQDVLRLQNEMND